MCTFKDERTVLVCDVAIHRVREEIDPVFGDSVRYTTIDGKGTLVEAETGREAEHFTDIVRAGITESQKLSDASEAS